MLFEKKIITVCQRTEICPGLNSTTKITKTRKLKKKSFQKLKNNETTKITKTAKKKLNK